MKQEQNKMKTMLCSIASASRVTLLTANCYLLTALLLLTACSDWNDWNTADTAVSGTATTTLYQNMLDNEDLSQFAALIKQGGLDDELEASQYYTVFAPANGTFDYDYWASEDSAILVKKFLYNHIARYAQTASGDLDANHRVHTLNNKSFIFTGNGSYTYDEINIDEANVPSVNGITHILDGYAPFYNNIYENLSEQQGADSIASYFLQYESSYLDESSSVEGPIVDGKQTYLDSVMVTTNTLTNTFRAYIDREDSTYTMLMPIDSAYISLYNTITSYYTYPTTITYYEVDPTAKTYSTTFLSTKSTESVEASYLQDSIAKRQIAQNLVFNHNNYVNEDVINGGTYKGHYGDIAGTDTLLTTRSNRLSNGNEILSHTIGEREKMSNGYVRYVDSLAFRPWETYNPEIEVNSPMGYYACKATAGKKTATDSITGLTICTYYDAVPSASTSQTRIYYRLNNVRATTYNVYIMFVQNQDVTEDSPNLPYKYSVSINYGTSAGVYTVNSSPVWQEGNKTALTNSDTYLNNVVDTILVGQVTFPTCYYGVSSAASPYLYIMSKRSTISKTEWTVYDNELRVAGVILRPVDYDEYLAAQNAEATTEDEETEEATTETE